MFREIPLSEIVDCPNNPRQVPSKEADRELLENIRTIGVLEPILVRPVSGLFECVFGSRRLRAAREIPLDTIPAIVREMNDEQALEAQLAENLRRDNMHPIDEAEAYRRMRDDYGHGAAEIATKLGANKAKILRRLQLCALSKSCASAFRKGSIELGIAEAISRVPDERHQDAVLNHLMGIVANGGKVTFENARSIIQRDYQLDLADPPFNPEDASLVAGVSACSECPKRTTNLKRLWTELDDGDRCTDAGCFKSKNEATWQAAKLSAEIEGNTIATAAQNRTMFGHGESVFGGYFCLDDKIRDDAKGRTWQRVIGKKLEPADVILARSPRGHVRRVVTSEKAFEIARDLGCEWAQRAEERAPSTPEQRARDAEKEALEKSVRLRSAELSVDRARASGLDERFVELVMLTMVGLSSYQLREIYEPQGVLMPGEGEGKEEKIVAGHVRKLAIESRVAECVRMITHLDNDAAEDAIATYDIDVAAVRKEAKETAKAAKKEKIAT